MAVVLSPIPSGRRNRQRQSPRLVTAIRPTHGVVGPYRPLPTSEPDRRCHQARPTRVGCDTEGRTTRSGAVVRRRRVLLGTMAAGLLVAIALPWGGTRGPLTTPGPALAGETVTHHAQYDVRPGDTLWSIAVRLDPTGDPRPVVARLAAQIGSDTVVPGEQLNLP